MTMHLEHNIHAEEFHPTNKNVEAIRNAPSLKNVKKLRAFLGPIIIMSVLFPNCMEYVVDLFINSIVVELNKTVISIMQFFKNRSARVIIIIYNRLIGMNKIPFLNVLLK